MPAEDIEQPLAELEKALTEIDTARAQLAEEIRALRRHEVTPAQSLDQGKFPPQRPSSRPM